MRTVTLRNTTLETSALGFGCASLTSLNDRGRALELLHAALDAGIRHFDVARAYGFGHAEGILGEFLQGRRSRITVTTKFGMQPPSAGVAGAVAGSPRLVRLAKTVLRHVPGLASLVRRRTQSMISGGEFTPAAAERSLATSLRELRTDHVDLLLLHECTLADARSDELLQWLDAQVARGTARHVGTGTAVPNLEGDVRRFPDRYSVFQLDHNARDRNLRRIAGLESRGVVTHGALKHAAALAEAVRLRPELARRWSDAVEADLRDDATRASLLLAHALRDNAAGVVLVSARHPDRVRANARTAEGELPTSERLAALERFVDEAFGASEPGPRPAAPVEEESRT
jgi:D-threo-aldose 1-dehydrogenase